MTIHYPLGRAACLLIALASAPALAADGTREMMADVMSRMMEAMGLFGSAGAGAGMSPMAMAGPNWGLGPGGFGAPGAMPWGSGMPDPKSGFGQMMRPFSGATGMPWSGAPLEGIWEGRNGELLIVQGNRFRLYPGESGYLDGYLQVSGGRLALYNPGDEQARPFEYAESDGRLVLRDPDGQIYLYRRLILDPEPARAPPQAPLP
ncbi:MAG: hypothetical protein MUC77_13515 [Chromatiaceae bacterium]|jgi:hypothetical protein|nr:hypothetical protein [Chromatiaceae bacterium]